MLRIAKSIVVNDNGDMISIGQSLGNGRIVAGIAIFEHEDEINFDPLFICIDEDGFQSVEDFIPIGGYVPIDVEHRDSVVCRTCPHARAKGKVIREAIAFGEMQQQRSAINFAGKDLDA